MSEFLPFSKPSINQAAIAEVVDCLQSGWITTGPRVKLFEQALQDYLKSPFVSVLNSATSGLHLALKSFDLNPGDEVITTPMTFVATLNTIVHCGAKPVLVDVDLATYNIDIEQIKAAITPRTKVIMPVHYAGIPVDLDPIYALARQHGLRVLEDAAHAIGSFYKDRIIGSFGDTQVFSFHPNKVMTTGEGGCVTTNDEDIFNKINIMRFHGIDREAWNRNAKQGSQYYDVINPGYKYNMMDIQAALGIHQLPALEEFIAKRTKLALRYQKILENWPEWILPSAPPYPIRNSWYIYAPLINGEAAGLSRDDFMKRMKEHDIGTGLHYQAVHLYSYYQQQFGFKRGQFPNAEIISDNIISLPLFPDMRENEQDRVIETMCKIFKHE
jgi:dTDP-4-amino-4,6-dideoxygalactose transaminase